MAWRRVRVETKTSATHVARKARVIIDIRAEEQGDVVAILELLEKTYEQAKRELEP